jgi:hypothetical protein
MQTVSMKEWSIGHPLTLVGFMEVYTTQDACRRALFEQRGREGFRCPRDRRPLRVGLALVLEDHAHGTFPHFC